jgi:peptidoglycan/LPS O-acetylase OafA/YrhL
MDARHPRWNQLAVGTHLLVVGLASWQLATSHAKPVYAAWAILSGVSLFVLTGLVHEASHRLLARWWLLNELAGNLAGWLVLTPLSAYRAFHLKHHQTTNDEGDPNAPLNSRWMLAIGSAVYTSLIHRYAWVNLRGAKLARYVFETAGMCVLWAALLLLLPRALRERALFLPIAIVALLQNIRIVTEHLDLGPQRYHDTWQLALPRWLSGWLLHYDHHLEHHLRPGLHWHELPGYRADLAQRQDELKLLRVSLVEYFRDVFLRRTPGTSRFDPAPATPATPRRLRLRADVPERDVRAQGSPGPRYHGLDALRGIAMILVVVLHAALAYAATPLPNLIWTVRDPSAHAAFDLLCWWTLGISSPFYLMSGFFAAELCEARGTRAFLVSRCKRIVGPFLAAGVIVLPATFFIWVGGWLISGQCTPREFVRMKFHALGYQRNLYGPAHLWSLEYLAVMLAFYAAYRALRGRLRPAAQPTAAPGWLHLALTSPWKPLLLALPTTLILWAGHRQLGLDAIMDRANSFVPEPFRLGHNLVFFVVGVSMHWLRDDLLRMARHGWAYLGLSVPVFAFRAFLIRQDLLQPLHGTSALALAASGALFTWLITFGLLGVALGLLNRPRPGLSYLGDCSYWVYLCHLPIVGLLQVDLYPLAIPGAAKFAVALSGTLLLCIASYQVAVRHTFLGLWLHGRRERLRPVDRIRLRPLRRDAVRSASR